MINKGPIPRPRMTSFTSSNDKLRILLRFDPHLNLTWPPNYHLIFTRPIHDPNITFIRRFWTSPGIHLTFTWALSNPYLTLIRRFWTSPVIYLNFTWNSPDIHLITWPSSDPYLDWNIRLGQFDLHLISPDIHLKFTWTSFDPLPHHKLAVFSSKKVVWWWKVVDQPITDLISGSSLDVS